MSICAGVIVAVALKQIDGSPNAQACTKGYYQSLQNTDCAVEKCHKFVLLCPDPKYSWWITGPSVMKNVDITKPSSKPHVHLQPEKGRKIARTDDQSALAM